MTVTVDMRWVIPEGTSTEWRVLQFAVHENGAEGDFVVQDWTTVKMHCVKRADYSVLMQTGMLPDPPKDSQ